MGKLPRRFGANGKGRKMELRRLRQETHAAPRMTFLKRLFWVYFLLLIFEGALRKWVFPQLSGPLLLVRDPIAIFIIWEAYRTHKWPKRWSAVVGILSISMLALCTLQVVSGETTWLIALYGLHSYLLPFPVAFIMGENLDVEDLRRFGVWTLWLLLPLTLLAVMQYHGASNSIWNVGANKGSVQLNYAGGHVRASETFSYVTGPANYVPLAAAFICYGLVDDKFAKKWLLYAAAIAVPISVAVIGSRSLLVLLAMLLGCVAVAAAVGVSQLTSVLKVVAALAVLTLLASQLPIFSEAMDTFQTRLSEASGSEGTAQNLWEREFTEFSNTNITDTGVPWYGQGVGTGSNVASTLLAGTQQFMAGEGEFGRVFIEFGLPFGGAFLLFRFLLALAVAARAFSKVRDNQPLAWFLVPLMFSAMLGTLEQPTIQGFMVLSLGFSLAAIKGAATPVASLPMHSNLSRNSGPHLRPRTIRR